MKGIPTMIYSRVVGYFQPTVQWNKGKQEEFRERTNYSLGKIMKSLDADKQKTS